MVRSLWMHQSQNSSIAPFRSLCIKKRLAVVRAASERTNLYRFCLVSFKRTRINIHIQRTLSNANPHRSRSNLLRCSSDPRQKKKTYVAPAGTLGWDPRSLFSPATFSRSTLYNSGIRRNPFSDSTTILNSFSLLYRRQGRFCSPTHTF